ncbi:DUF2891 domain-containing protein [bacterium]|nr:DUF2891 domain-containing protein [bacterium]
MKTFFRLNIILLAFLFSCVQYPKKPESNEVSIPETAVRLELTDKSAEKLVQLPIKCIDIEYPNKLNQVIGSDNDLRSPKDLHPAFYGCFDWHSAVHGHWSLVRLLKEKPELEERERILNGLKAHLSVENIAAEIKYFEDSLSQGFERTYGWAWLLKLADELETWDDPQAKQLSENMKPLADVIVARCEKFLPKLHYPIRVGTHTNTAFALCMVYDYAETMKNESLMKLIKERAIHFYETDTECPLSWEPSGYDFLSPCFEEADLMRRVYSKEEFKTWLEKFLPELSDPTFKLAPAIVSDRTDGHLVHLDGLNFSRAWCLYGIAKALPSDYGHLVEIGNKHIKYSFDNLVGDSYEGGHWLASFALLALAG